MSAHTPGPWFVVDYGVDDGENLTTISTRFESSPGDIESGWPEYQYKKVAATDDSCFDQETNLANARLIAAAPVLLLALQALILARDGIGSLEESWSFADSVIDKALRDPVAEEEERQRLSVIAEYFGTDAHPGSMDFVKHVLSGLSGPRCFDQIEKFLESRRAKIAGGAK